MKKIFCTDLDGTIICNDSPKEFGICVAVKDGVNASFMYNDTYDKFIDITKKILVVPTTTRHPKSYNNIYLKKFFNYALVNNGATLICDSDEESKLWENESRKIIENERKEFETLRKIIEDLGYKEKWGSEFVLDCVHPCITDDVINYIKDMAPGYSKNILVNPGHSSLICTYKNLSKGKNIERFAKRYGYELYISAGDSKEDESMFNLTKYSIGTGASIEINETNKLDYCAGVVNKVLDILDEK